MTILGLPHSVKTVVGRIGPLRAAIAGTFRARPRDLWRHCLPGACRDRRAHDQAARSAFQGFHRPFSPRKDATRFRGEPGRSRIISLSQHVGRRFGKSETSAGTGAVLWNNREPPPLPRRLRLRRGPVPGTGPPSAAQSLLRDQRGRRPRARSRALPLPARNQPTLRRPRPEGPRCNRDRTAPLIRRRTRGTEHAGTRPSLGGCRRTVPGEPEHHVPAVRPDPI